MDDGLLASSPTRPAVLPVTPTVASTRIVPIDALRGVAIFGLLIVNFKWAYVTPDFLKPPTAADQVVDWIVAAFVANKFYTVFAILFGASFVLQDPESTAARSAGLRTDSPRSFVIRWCRRMVALFAIGLSHAVLLWHGDILEDYARSGVYLLLFRRVRVRGLVVAAGIILVVFALGGSGGDGWTRVGERVGLSHEATDPLQSEHGAGTGSRCGVGYSGWALSDMSRTLHHGSYADVVSMRVDFVRCTFQGPPVVRYLLPPFYTLEYFALFLLGMAGARALGFAERRGTASMNADANWLPQYVPALGAVTAIGLGICLPVVCALAAGSPWTKLDVPVIHQTVDSVVELPMRIGVAIAYCAGLLLLWTRKSWRRLLTALAPVGRMALTNYLLQSLFFSTLLYGYGLGLWGVLSRVDTILLAIVFFAVQVGVSTWWLKRFRLGPTEWLWRTLTYWRPQPMRRTHQAR